MFLIDRLRTVFLFTVNIITSTILIFRKSYIAQEKFYARFHFVLIIFVASIVFLILRPRLFSALIGWDGLGLTSFILVIYYGNSKSFNAGIITAITNRLGDGILILGLAALIPFGDPAIFWYTIFWEKQSWLIIILVVACFTKRAQIPFSAWLPAAIAAPTPVSSLVHSSTLVTAGVYLLIRHLYWLPKGAGLLIILILGRLTILMARISAFAERDIKKIIALSTLRQLGVIVVALGLNIYLLSFLHLIAHAFFKALLFVSVGNLIHANRDYQALSLRGKLSIFMPSSYSCVIICRLSLMGFPFISAFYSKEPIIELCNSYSLSTIVYLIIFIGILITRAYSTRIFILTGVSFLRRGPLVNKQERFDFCTLGIITLFSCAILGGNFLMLLLLKQPLFFITSPLTKILVLFILIIGIITGGLISYFPFPKFLNKNFFNMWSLPWISSMVFFKPSRPAIKNLRVRDLGWVWNTAANFSFNNSVSYSFTINTTPLNKIFLIISIYFLIALAW